MNGRSHLRVLSTESKVRKLCITQGLTLGDKGLKRHCMGIFEEFYLSCVIINAEYYVALETASVEELSSEFYMGIKSIVIFGHFATVP